MNVRLLGARRGAQVQGVDALAARTNYLLGNDPSKWRTGVHNFERVRYSDVYPGIDLIFHGAGAKLEYDFVLKPGADPRKIRLSFQGAKELALADDGSLRIDGDGCSFTQGLPAIYQDHAGTRVKVAGHYRLHGNIASFEVASYDRRQALIIDPTLTFATYLGGSSTENQGNMALDQAGNSYVTGNTFSTDFPVSKTPVQPVTGGTADVFVSKFSSTGALVYSTYVGGSAGEDGMGIAVDTAGNAYVTGFTTSTNFPTVNAYQTSNRGGELGTDAFLFKLNAAGTALVYSTYLGGNDDDLGLGVAVDAGNNAYVAGTSFSLNYPTTAGAFQAFAIGFASFVTKFAPTGQTLVYSTLVGGNGEDTPSGIAVDTFGNAFVLGNTSSTTFPVTAGAFQRTNRGGPNLATDAFVYKLNPTGSALVYSTLLGGTGDEMTGQIAIDSSGAAYVTGSTGSTDFPTTVGVVQNALSGPSDAFVAKIDPTGSSLSWSTFFGGTRSDSGTGIAVDSFANVYVSGSSTSTNLPMVAPSQATPGGSSDIFVIKLNTGGTAVLQSTYFGGPGDEFASGAALDSSGSLLVYGGSSSSTGISTPGASQPTYGGGNSDSLLAKFNFAIDINSLTISPAALVFTANVGDTIPKQQLSISAIPGSRPGWTIMVSTATGGGWLNVSPLSGVGSGTVDVTVNASGLALGTYSGTIAITNMANNSTTKVPVTLTLATPAGRITQAGVVNGASFQPGPLSPGLIVTVFGSNLGPATLVGAQLDPSGKLATLISDTEVLFDGIPAPLVYVSATQLSAIVPYEVANQTTTQLQVQYKGVKSTPLTLAVAPSDPGIFTADTSGKGQGAIQNQDGSYNNASNPAAMNSIIVLYVTGEGQTTPAGVDGQIATTVFPKPSQMVVVKIGGVPCEILYAGAVSGVTAGLMQVNVRIPPDTQSGAVPLTVTVGAATSQVVTLAVQ